MNNVLIADTDEKVLHCIDVIQSLRPHITNENLLSYFHKMKGQNYHIIYTEVNGKPVAFSGYRFITHFFSGDIIYIDDLGTLPEFRGKGFGSLLLDYIFDIAKQKNLDGVQLDSGHHRYDAHRLYLTKGFKIVSHHFNLKYRDPK